MATGGYCAGTSGQRPGDDEDGNDSNAEPWDDWMPEVQTALDFILKAEAEKAAVAAAAAKQDDEGDDDDDWNPTVQGAAEQTKSGQCAAGDDEDSEDDWAPTVQGAASVEDTQQEALKALLKPTHLLEREQERQRFDTKREADAAGKVLQELKRPPTIQEAREEIRAAAREHPETDVDALPQPSDRDMAEDEAVTLVERGATVNSKGQHGRAPLHKAAEVAYPRLCRTICGAGGDPDTRDNYGETPLLLLARSGETYEGIPVERRREAIQTLLALGADVHAVNPRGRGVVHLAAAENDHMVLQTCIEGLANIDCQDLAGFTALMWAAGRNGIGTIKMLLDRRADANLKAVRGQTALTFALTNGNNEVVDLLEQHQVLMDQEKANGLPGEAEVEEDEEDEDVDDSDSGRQLQVSPPPWACTKPVPDEIEPYEGRRVYKDAKPNPHSNVYA